MYTCDIRLTFCAISSEARTKLQFFRNELNIVLPLLVIGLEVNADKTKYMIMSRDQNAGRRHSMRIDNSSIERVEEFKYLGTI
jgi:hypothetical protein